MGIKSNIRSMRFSDDIIDMIERQAGENFSQKFESLVKKCYYELPAKERELRFVELQIEDKKRALKILSDKYYGLERLFAPASSSCEGIAKQLFSMSKKM